MAFDLSTWVNKQTRQWAGTAPAPPPVATGTAPFSLGNWQNKYTMQWRDGGGQTPAAAGEPPFSGVGAYQYWLNATKPQANYTGLPKTPVGFDFTGWNLNDFNRAYNDYMNLVPSLDPTNTTNPWNTNVTARNAYVDALTSGRWFLDSMQGQDSVVPFAARQGAWSRTITPDLENALTSGNYGFLDALINQLHQSSAQQIRDYYANLTNSS